MPWIPPKTNWSASPLVSYTDFNRIEGNTVELKKAVTIDLADQSNFFTTKNVEAALQQIKRWILGS